MWNDASSSYLESQILTAEPIELVRLLYQGCMSAVREARRHLAEGEIAARSRAITKAQMILTELTSSLDHARGAEISRRLAQLYDYMQRRLIEANCQQADGPMAEVLGLLSTISEGWDGLHQQTAPDSPAESAWRQPLAPEPAPGYAPQSPWTQHLPAEPTPAYAPPSPWAQPQLAPEPAPAYASQSPWAQQLPPEPAPPYASQNPWAQPLPSEVEPAYASHAWSL